MLKFKIIEINDTDHSVVVRFYTDKITEEMLAIDILDEDIRRCRTDYNIDLPMPTPIGEELDSFLIKFAPIDWLAKQEMLLENSQAPLSSILTKHFKVEKTSENVEQNIHGSISQINDVLMQAAIQRVLINMTDDTI